LIILALLTGGVGVLSGVGRSDRHTPTDQALPRGAAPSSVLRGSSTTLLAWPVPGGGPDNPINVDDLATGNVSLRSVPYLTGGDIGDTAYAPAMMLVGRWLVYNSAVGVTAIDQDLRGAPRTLGSLPWASWFVPSVRDTILVVHAHPGPSPVSVRRVSVATGAMSPIVTLPHDTQVVIEGTDHGLLLVVGKSNGVVELWRPGHAPTRLAIPPDAITNGLTADSRAIAFGSACRSQEAQLPNGPTSYTMCAHLRVLNFIDHRSFSFSAPHRTLGWMLGQAGLYGALTFAPHDNRLAAQAATRPARNGTTRLFVLDLSHRSASPIAVPESNAPFSSTAAWSTNGSWLLYQGPGARLHAFSINGKSQTLTMRCCSYVAMVSVPSQSH
jgi:hypothetical protein